MREAKLAKNYLNEKEMRAMDIEEIKNNKLNKLNAKGVFKAIGMIKNGSDTPPIKLFMPQRFLIPTKYYIKQGKRCVRSFKHL